MKAKEEYPAGEYLSYSTYGNKKPYYVSVEDEAGEKIVYHAGEHYGVFLRVHLGQYNQRLEALYPLSEEKLLILEQELRMRKVALPTIRKRDSAPRIGWQQPDVAENRLVRGIRVLESIVKRVRKELAELAELAEKEGTE